MKEKTSGHRLLILGVAFAFLALLVSGVMLSASPVYADDGTAPPPDAAPAVEPPAVEPAAVEPAAVEPAAVEPAAVEPAAVEPAAVEPAAVEPALADTGTVPTDTDSIVDVGQVDGAPAVVDDTAVASATVQTDQPDYAPTDTPVISGGGFATNTEVTGTVTDPNGNVTTFTATTNEQGQFTINYEGGLTQGTYSVTANDGTNTASITFTDGSFQQITVNDNLPGSLDADFTVTYTKNGDTYTKDKTTTWSYYVDKNSTVTVSSPESPITSGDTRYAFSGYSPSNSVTMSNDKTITLNYTVSQYYLDVNDGGLGTATGEGWYNVGATADFIISPTTVEDGGTRYGFTGWTGTHAGSYTGTDVSHSVVMNNPMHETANWDETAYLLTVKTDGIDDASHPTNVYLGGSLAGTAYDGLSFTQWFDAGASTGKIGVDAIISAPFTQYDFDEWSASPHHDNPRGSVTMNEPRTYTAEFDTPSFEIAGVYSSNASGTEKNSFLPTESVYATITTWGGSGDESTHVHIYVTADKTSWTINASLNDVSGGFNGVDVPFGGGTYEVWSANTTLGNYDIVADVNLNGKYGCEPEENPDKVDSILPIGFIVTPPTVDVTITSAPAGDGFVNVGGNPITTPTTFSWTIGDIYTLEALSPVSGGTGTQYVFDSWSDLGAQTHDYTVPGSSETVTAYYDTQYYLTVDSAYDTPGGEGWYDEDATPSATLDTGTVVITPNAERVVFTGWSGDASGTGLTSDPITMDGAKTATADWTTQYYLTVTSPYDTPGGEGWYDVEDTAYATLDTLTVPGPGGTYDFIYWYGDASGTTSPSDPIIMYAPQTALAVWTFTQTPMLGELPTMLVISWFGTNVMLPVGSDGGLFYGVTITSPDGAVTLIIPAGTPVLNPDGTIAQNIWAILGGTPAPPAGTSIVAAYQLLPSGITFDPAVQLIIKYDPTKVPTGSVVVIAYYDEAAGKWVELETAGYIAGGTPVPDTVTTNISHFTYFAVLAKLPK